MTWNALQFVTNGVTLIAFIAAVAAVYRGRIRHEGEVIKSAPGGRRAEIIKATLSYFAIRAVLL